MNRGNVITAMQNAVAALGASNDIAAAPLEPAQLAGELADKISAYELTAVQFAKDQAWVAESVSAVREHRPTNQSKIG